MVVGQECYCNCFHYYYYSLDEVGRRHRSIQKYWCFYSLRTFSRSRYAWPVVMIFGIVTQLVQPTAFFRNHFESIFFKKLTMLLLCGMETMCFKKTEKETETNPKRKITTPQKQRTLFFSLSSHDQLFSTKLISILRSYFCQLLMISSKVGMIVAKSKSKQSLMI